MMQRSRLKLSTVFLAVFISSCTTATIDEENENGGSNNGGSNNGGSNNGGSNNEANLSYGDIVKKLATIYTDYVDACCSLSPIKRGELFNDSLEKGNEYGFDPVAEGFFRIDQEAVNACLNESERLSKSCGVRPFSGVMACDASPFIPLKNEGDSCQREVDGSPVPLYRACVQGTYCDDELGVCIRKRQLGESCNPDIYEQCNDSLICGSNSTCEQGAREGERCNEELDLCTGETDCIDGTCVSYDAEDFAYAQMPMNAEECAEFN
jgi:hypothetical protein